MFFKEIRPILHGVEEIGRDFSPEHFTPASKLTEKDFVFAPGTVDDMYKMFTLTTIFVTTNPRPENQLPAPGATLKFIDESFSRPEGYIDQAVRQRLKKYFDMPSPPYISPKPSKCRSTIERIVRHVHAFVRRS